MNESSLAVRVVPDGLVLLGIAIFLGAVIATCISRFSKSKREPKCRSFSEAFDDLLCKYALVGKADLKEEFNVDNLYRFTLLRKINHEAERSISLPEKFIEEMRALVYEFFGDSAWRSTKKELVFRVREQGMTLEEIHSDQKAWEYHCRAFWSSYD